MFIDYGISMLGVVESSFHNGPINFDCFLDFTLGLSDPHILKALTLNIKTSKYEMLEESQPLALIYRIYYECIKTNLNIQAIYKHCFIVHSKRTLSAPSKCHKHHVTPIPIHM